MDDLFDRIAKAIDPEAFSDKVTAQFSRAAIEGRELAPDAVRWMPRIIAARMAASRVFDVIHRPTPYMERAAEALEMTTPGSTPTDYYRMMIYAERDLAQRRDAPGIDLEAIEPEEFFAAPGM